VLKLEKRTKTLPEPLKNGEKWRERSIGGPDLASPTAKASERPRSGSLR
jgi:hypothetical protein